MWFFFFFFLHVIWNSGVNIESPWEEPQAKRPDHHQWVQQTDHSSSLVKKWQTQERKEDPEMFWTHFKACEINPDWLGGQQHIHCSYTDQKHQHNFRQSNSTVRLRDTGSVVQSADVHHPPDSTRLLQEHYVEQILMSK